MSMPRLRRSTTCTPAAWSRCSNASMRVTRAGGEVGRAARVERQEIHQRAERCGEGGELIGQLGRIVPSPDQHVFERHPPAKLLQRAEDLRQPVLLFDRHQLEAQRRRRRVQ